MQTLKQGFEERNLMAQLAEDLAQDWRSRLKADCPEQSAATTESIIHWLLGNDLERFALLNPNQLEIARQAMAYRYRILRHRYLGLAPEQAYRHLITRLGSLVLLRQKIRTWVALSRDRQRAVVDVLQEVLQELLHSDRYMQQQMTWIAECTSDVKLRNALLLASTEEYCLRPIRNQPLLVYRFVNYLRRTSRGGITQVPTNDLIRLVSDEVVTDDSDRPISLFDTQALAAYQDTQTMEQQQVLRQAVQQEFSSYLATQLGPIAVQWLQLYLQGRSQEAIARKLNLPVKEIYRLREKISYHAVRVFALKYQPELVGNWLETSLLEHSFGLKPQQWQQFWERLTPRQRQMIELLKGGKDIEAIAQSLNLKSHQVMGEWSKLYLTAQAIRCQG
ncbi:HetZ-related protein 2 [Chroococcidiopsis sp. CCMEE 29]|uniref:HetZ-related protein 2 n=1 Tax=Chroococcidiopsis sp. CCMEE 29 TaxID=155894 RepID=UPI002020CE38|nr:HetZ-related protein 2 [Chroococcidiopsis sp. CCMEE 29]